jgi:hypothetical protein
MKKLIYLSVILLALTSCEKSFENFNPNQTNNTDSTIWEAPNTGTFTAINNLHLQLIRDAYTDSINVAEAKTISFPEGLKVEIPANAFSKEGVVATGKAKIIVIHLRTKGDFIRYRKPTVSNGYLLESGGSFYVAVTKNDLPLNLLPSKQIKFSFKDPNPNTAMVGFIGNGPIAGTGASVFNWERTDSLQATVQVRTTQTGYDMFSGNLNWINCDYFRDTAAPKTRIALVMPTNFTNANTSCFIVYKNIKAVMQFDAEPANKIWKKDRVPVNASVLYVTVSKYKDELYLGIKETTTALNQNIEINPVKKTAQELDSFLNSL